MLNRKANLNMTVVGLTWIVVAGLNFVGFVVLIKYVGSELPPVQAAFIRYLFGLIVVLPCFSVMESTSLPQSIFIFMFLEALFKRWLLCFGFML